ncbi:SDR family NAD(P)-dependent oxidoreductase [Thalassotalea eurytherma]|uniref:Oxidoreductase EphD n=1 Tax=Thalassotalea eurytherma TaxID=1144278 RepID=A0ABQ6GXE0_9GAMM|nr:SDR family NAD(P)-dependent oxidoreductase [Thalassotalea eurytherma]GLX80608.1 putative oxidoreductase EphD [Thalassotalea eurytherma]
MNIVFITGAADGIGLECALAFAREGYSIAATDINEAGLVRAKTMISALGVDCRTYQLDVSNEEQFILVANEVIAQMGCPNVVINNAGIGFHAGFEATTPEMWRKTYDINVFGVVSGCRAFLQPMKDSDQSCVLVNVSSLSSKSPMPNLTAYVSSKYAVEGFTESLAIELAGSNVSTLCVHPAVINTAIVKNTGMIGSDITAEQLERLQNYYVNHGAHPSVVANDIVRAVVRGQQVLYTGPNGKVTNLISRLLPKTTYRRLLRKLSVIVGYGKEVQQ